MTCWSLVRLHQILYTSKFPTSNFCCHQNSINPTKTNHWLHHWEKKSLRKYKRQNKKTFDISIKVKKWMHTRISLLEEYLKKVKNNHWQSHVKVCRGYIIYCKTFKILSLNLIAITTLRVLQRTNPRFHHWKKKLKKNMKDKLNEKTLKSQRKSKWIHTRISLLR